MRGFQKQKIIIEGEERPALEGFDYTSATSGGNIAQVLYAYPPDTTSDLILDADGINDPSLITTDFLENVPETSLFSRLSSVIGPVAAVALVKALLFDLVFWDVFLYDFLLAPFGVVDYTSIGKTRDDVKATPIVTTPLIGPSEVYPEYINTVMNQKFLEVLVANAHILGEVYLDPAIPPFSLLPTNNTILWEIAKEAHYQIPYSAYITPDEFGIPMLKHEATYDGLLDAKNQTVLPLDFCPASEHPDDVQPEAEGPFTLKKMLGVGTTFVSIRQETFPPDVFRPNTVNIPTADGSTRNMALTDGGYNDNGAIFPLLHKKVKTIVFNAFLPGESAKLVMELGYPASGTVFSAVLANYFGVFNSAGVPDPSFYNFPYSFTRHVFDLHSNGENQMFKFLEIADSLHAAGEPIIVTLKDLDVLYNPFHGIEGGWKVDLTIIAPIGVPKKFAEQVNQTVVPPPPGMNFTDELGFFTNEDVAFAPNPPSYSNEPLIPPIPALGFEGITVDVNPIVSTKLMRMTEIMTSWMIEHSWDGLVGADGEVEFGGFAEIFEGL